MSVVMSAAIPLSLGSVLGVMDMALSLLRSGGQAQSRHRRLQSPHRGLVSSHFFLRRLHIRQPVCTLRMRALGMSDWPVMRVLVAPLESRGLQGKLRRTHRAHGRLPSQACLIWAQRWQTGRLSEPMATGHRLDQSRIIRYGALFLFLFL